MKYSSWLPEQALSSTVIILGNVFGLFLNLIVNISYGAMVMYRRSSLRAFPQWLVYANFIFFIIQLILTLK